MPCPGSEPDHLALLRGEDLSIELDRERALLDEDDVPSLTDVRVFEAGLEPEPEDLGVRTELLLLEGMAPWDKRHSLQARVISGHRGECSGAPAPSQGRIEGTFAANPLSWVRFSSCAPESPPYTEHMARPAQMRKHRSSPSRASSDALPLPLEAPASAAAEATPDLRLVMPEESAETLSARTSGATPARTSGATPARTSGATVPASTEVSVAEAPVSSEIVTAVPASADAPDIQATVPASAEVSVAETPVSSEIVTAVPASADAPDIQADATANESPEPAAETKTEASSPAADSSELASLVKEPKAESAPVSESAKFAKAVAPPSVVEESSINYDDEGLLELELDDMQYRFDAGKQGTALCLSVREVGTYRWSSLGELKWDGRDLRSKAVDRKLLARLSLALREYSQAQGE
jgi:hypothetical protein